MATFSVVINESRLLAGITAARERYNEDNAGVEGFVPLSTNADYVQFVMTRAAQSYASQYAIPE